MVYTIQKVWQVIPFVFIVKSSNVDIFGVTGPLWGESAGLLWIPLTQRPVTRSFDVFFDVRLEKQQQQQQNSGTNKRVAGDLSLRDIHVTSL